MTRGGFDKARLATPLLMLGVFFWGATFAAVKQAVAVMDVYSFLTVRFAISTAILCIIFHNSLRAINKEILFKGVLIGAMLAVSFITQTTGLKYTTASNSAFITGIYIVLVPLSVVFLDRRFPGWPQTLAVLLALAGLALITLKPGFRIGVGDVWTLICAAAFGVHVVMIGRMIRNIDARAFTIVQLMTVAVISAAVGLATNRTIRLTSDPIAWRSIFFCAVFAGAYMYFVQARFQRYMSEIKAVIVYSFEPMYGALIAMALLGERLSAKAWIGGACVIAAMVLADIKFKPRNGVPAE